MTHPVLAHARCFGAAAIVAAVTVSGASAQQPSMQDVADSLELAEPTFDPATGEEVVDAEIFAQTTAPEIEQTEDPTEEGDGITFLTAFEVLDYDVVLSNERAVAYYRSSYRLAQEAAQNIYDAEAAFNALYNLTPEQVEEQFPDGGYDDALNAANDAFYWAMEDGRSASATLREARFRLAGGPISDEQAAELDRLLGL